MRKLNLGRGRLRLEALEERSLLSATPLIDPPPYDPTAEVALVEPGDEIEKVDEAVTSEEVAVCDILPEEMFYTCDLMIEGGDEVVVTDAGAVEVFDPIDPVLYEVGVDPVDPELLYCTFVVDDLPADPDAMVKRIDIVDLPAEDEVGAEPIDDVKVLDDVVYYPVAGNGVIDPNDLMFYTMSPVARGNEPTSPSALECLETPEVLPVTVDTSVSSISMTLPPATIAPAPQPIAAPSLGNDPAIAVALGDGQEPEAPPDGPSLAESETAVVEPVATATPRVETPDAPAVPASTKADEARPNDLLVAVDLPY